MPQQDERLRGVLCAISAFTWWGLTPLYFNAIDYISVSEVLASRVIWTVLLLSALIAVMGRLASFKEILRNRKLFALLVFNGVILCSNWWVFTWAVTHDQILETSLGYFINPLFSVFLGVIFLRERLRTGQKLAVLLAIIGVAYMVVDHGRLPWVSLFLPVTFGFYGFVRKQIAVDPISGLLTEMLIVLPFALGYAIMLAQNGTGHFGPGHGIDSGLLILVGPLTIFPLVMFAAGARRINLSTLGFIQYLAPSLNVILAVFVFHEEFGHTQLVTFSFIWCSLAIFTFEGVRFNRLGSQRREITEFAE